MSNTSETSVRELKNWAVEAAPVGVVVTDATTEDNPIIYANDRFTDVTGYPEPEVLGRNCRFLQGPDTAEEPVSELRAAIDEARSTSVELLNYRRDGTSFWNAVTVAPIETDDGSVTHFVGFQQDVTERVENERALRRQKERFEQFANVISHDLKNPLNILGVSVELAEETGDPEHFEKATRTIDRMNAMIEDLLILAREGETVGELTDVHLPDVVDACWQHVEAADATLVNETGSTIGADRDRLEQLFDNLLLNAVDHGGEMVTVGELDGGFFVEDDGDGIPEEHRDRVFEAGYTTSRDGTGFGLEIVERIVEAHGWAIDVTDGADGGARFEVTGVTFA